MARFTRLILQKMVRVFITDGMYLLIVLILALSRLATAFTFIIPLMFRIKTKLIITR